MCLRSYRDSSGMFAERIICSVPAWMLIDLLLGPRIKELLGVWHECKP
jgi:hypothetical protein